jgi:RNA polymerase sigma factor (sigma-70 family)
MNPNLQSKTFDLAALRDGNTAAWDEFFTAFDDDIKYVPAWKKWNFDRHTQEDVTQLIRIELMKAVPTLRDDSRLAPFVKQVCIRRCIDEIRRQVRVRQVQVSSTFKEEDGGEKTMEEPSGEAYDPRRAVIDTEQAAALKRLVGKLDETCRATIRYFYFEGLSYREIAEKKNVTVSTVGARLSKCMEKLRSRMKHEVIFAE